MIRCRHDDRPARLRDPGELAAEGTWVLQVLDNLYGRNHVGELVSERQRHPVEISGNEVDAGREVVVADRIDTNTLRERRAELSPEVAAATPDVGKHASRSALAEEP